MKIIKTSTYKIIESSFEGQVFTPEVEDEFVSDVLTDNKRRKRNLNYPTSIPSSYKARHPTSISPDRNQYFNLRNLGEERGFVEDPFNIGDAYRKKERIQKAIERDNRLDSDRYDFYKDLDPSVVEGIMRDVERYERENPGKTISDQIIKMLLIRRKNSPTPVIRKLKQLNRIDEKIAYSIDDDVMIELSEQEETNTILDFLHFINGQIDNFAKSKNVDPDSLKDFLYGIN